MAEKDNDDFDSKLDPANSPDSLAQKSAQEKMADNVKEAVKNAPQKTMDFARSPEHLWGGKRINNLPKFLAMFVLIGFVLVVVFVGSRKAAQQNVGLVEEDDKQANRVSMIDVQGMDNFGLIESFDLDKPPLPADVPEPQPKQQPVPKLPTPQLTLPSQSTNLGAPLDEDMMRLKQQRMNRLNEAARAKTSVPFLNNRSGSGFNYAPARVLPYATASTANNANAAANKGASVQARLAAARQAIEQSKAQNPTAAYQMRLQQLRSGGNNLMTASANANQTLPASALFERVGDISNDRWSLNSTMQAPRSPFELRAGFVIPAVLIGAINSEIAGQIIGQVSQNVYDTATGANLLIPQGSRLVGQYSSNIAYGQSRVLVTWERIVFPDGKAFDLGSMQGADGAGQAGFKDKVDNHYFRIFGQAILLSFITAGVTYSQYNYNYSSGNTQRAGDALSEAMGQQLGNTMTSLINKNLNISPTLEIRSGFRFNVIVTKDLTFTKAYESFDY